MLRSRVHVVHAVVLRAMCHRVHLRRVPWKPPWQVAAKVTCCTVAHRKAPATKSPAKASDHKAHSKEGRPRDHSLGAQRLRPFDQRRVPPKAVPVVELHRFAQPSPHKGVVFTPITCIL